VCSIISRLFPFLSHMRGAFSISKLWRQRMECCRRMIAPSGQVPLLKDVLHTAASHFTCTSRPLLHTLLALIVLLLPFCTLTCGWCFFCHSKTLVNKRMYLKWYTQSSFNYLLWNSKQEEARLLVAQQQYLARGGYCIVLIQFPLLLQIRLSYINIIFFKIDDSRNCLVLVAFWYVL
jgi:hypothetical protein